MDGILLQAGAINLIQKSLATIVFNSGYRSTVYIKILGALLVLRAFAKSWMVAKIEIIRVQYISG